MWRVRAGMLTLVIVCSTAQASNWVTIGESNDGLIETFIDVSSIRIEGDVRRAWFKSVYKTHTKKSTGNGKYWSYYVDKDAINCTQEMWRAEADIIHYEDGAYESMPAENYPKPWAPVPPDTLGSVKMQFICTWKS